MLAARSLVLALLILGLTSEYGIGESGGGILNNNLNQTKGEQSGTNDKASGCGNCIFPFIFNFVIIETCTSMDGDDPWCATDVDSDGWLITGAWEYCTSNTCPEPEPMIEHPENEVGKCYCGIPNSGNGNRIVGGVKTDVGEFPWQVALLSRNSIDSQICGGSLVSDRYVVTAAHCTAGRTASDLFVAVGDTILGFNGEASSFIYPVKTIKDHPDYIDATEGNDISLLELDAAIDLTAYPNIKPICLPAQGSTYGDQWATVSGWGTLGSSEPSPAQLNEVDVQIFADGNCGAMNWAMKSDMICAGIKAGGKDSCQGDSGGPLFLRDDTNNGAHTLAGVVSWGQGCALEDRLGIYAEVSHFRDWLDSQMTTFDSCSAPSAGTVPTASPVTTTTTTTTTTAPPTLDCWKKDYYPILKTIKTIKKIESVDICSEKCLQEESCEYYKWKNNKKVSKRTCYLQKIGYSKKKSYYGGPKDCSEHPKTWPGK